VTIARGTTWQVNSLTYNPFCPLKSDGNDFLPDIVNEWTLKSVSAHPFHLHLYHQQIQFNCGIGHDDGEFYDVVAAVSSGQDCTVRFISSDHSGRTTLHCHILTHEDGGAMGWINVKSDGPRTDTVPCCISGDCSECISEENLPNECGIFRIQEDQPQQPQQPLQTPATAISGEIVVAVVLAVVAGVAVIAILVVVLRKFGPGIRGYQNI